MIEYACVSPVSGPDICLGGTLNTNTGLWDFSSTDAVSYLSGTYNVELNGFIAGFPSQAASHTFSLTIIDPCSVATVTVPIQPSNPADYDYSGTAVSY